VAPQSLPDVSGAGRVAGGDAYELRVAATSGSGQAAHWQATKAAFLATTSISDVFRTIAPPLVAALLAGVFVCGLAICGYVAGFRNALWTITGLRR